MDIGSVCIYISVCLPSSQQAAAQRAHLPSLACHTPWASNNGNGHRWLKGNVAHWFDHYPVFCLWLGRFWHSCFFGARGDHIWAARTSAGTATVRLCPRWQVTLVAAPQIEGSPRPAFHGIISIVRLIGIKSHAAEISHKSSSPVGLGVYNTRSIAIFLNICLGWRSAPRLAAGVTKRERGCVWREWFSLKGDQSGFCPDY